VTLRFLIDENLSPDLTSIANLAGFYAVSVVHVGLAGTPDHILADIAERQDLIIVTNNAVDFRRLYALRKLHSGLVVILPTVIRERQMLLFDAALHYLSKAPDLINMCLSITENGAITIEPISA
jgi:predicted nuclease of predicted toxin-antitoxin system